MTLYAIPDIHGHLDQLDHALSLIEEDGGPEARVVFLGDYVDRGPDSRGVLQRLIDGLAAGRDWICLKGNHDRLMSWFLEPEPKFDPHMYVSLNWFHNRVGGTETLASYGVQVEHNTRLKEVHPLARAAVPQSHIDFLSRLRPWYEVDDLLFVHGGIRPGLPLSEQTEEDLVWIRDPFLKDQRDHPWLVVHGHTALETATHFGNRIDLDGGAAYGRPLVPAVFEGRACSMLTEAGRVPLLP